MLCVLVDFGRVLLVSELIYCKQSTVNVVVGVVSKPNFSSKAQKFHNWIASSCVHSLLPTCW